MSKRKIAIFAAAAAMVLALLAGLYIYGNRTEPEKESFHCFTYDNQGNVLDGYRSEQDGMWTLFLPSDLRISETEVFFTGGISAASAGQLDEENKCVSGAFEKSGDRLELTGEDGQTYSVAVMQSQLPSLYLSLKDTSLEEIHADKDVRHPGNSLYLRSADGKEDLSAESCVEIKGRGNSSWTMFGDKKGYQLKFDSKTSLLGMNEAKKWILIANACDDSMIRNQLAYHAASSMEMDFVPSFRYVDLWIDGDYRGTYMLGEKVEISENRLALTDSLGVLFEHDEAFFDDEDYCFFSAILQKHFVLKDTVEADESLVSAGIADFETALDRFSVYLYSHEPEEITLEDLSEMIDVDSFIKYYLLNEYVQNREAFASSFYWYKDGPEDVLHLGPIWDFDTCMGSDGAPYTENYGIRHTVFRFLLAVPEFYERTQELFALYKDELESLASYAGVLKKEIESSAGMNYIRWDVLGMPNPKGDVSFQNSFDEAVTVVQDWLRGRAEAFRLPEGDEIVKNALVTSTVSDDCRSMELYFRDEGQYEQIRFVVWSLNDGQDDLGQYAAKRDRNGVWHYTVDLAMHSSVGVYMIYAYADDSGGPIAGGYSYVESTENLLYKLSAQVSEDCKTMEITMDDSGKCSKMVFAVWSDVNDQDDIEWITAEKDSDGLWHGTVDLREHQSEGIYHIHAFSVKGSNQLKVATASVNVPFAVKGFLS